MRAKLASFIVFTVIVLAPLNSYAETDFYLGLGTSYVKHSNLFTNMRKETAPNVQLGVSRQFAENWRIGTGADFVAEEFGKSTRSKNILTWRTMSLDYRFTDSLAGHFYAGMTRFYRERPAYGYGFGAGIKYRLSDSLTFASDINWSEVDTSTNIPRDAGTHQRDTLAWLNAGVQYYF